jgi:UDP-GlcNAc:undecaprenyl-phosphate GlcNAc-1-phosphate transferase
MQSLVIVLSASVAAVTCLAAILALYPLAPRLGLIDHPGERRKIHHHAVPPIGGFCIFAGLLAAIVIYGPPTEQAGMAMLGATLLVVIGGLDDRFDLGYKLRFLAQIGAALILVLGAGVKLTSLGDLLGFGPIGLGPFAVPLSVFAIVGIINAFNMIDGIDGLAGGLALVVLLSLLVTGAAGAPDIAFLLPALSLALLPYLACNLGIGRLRGKKIFLGDAGSMLLGYIIVWALIVATQQPGTATGQTTTGPGIAPVIALWLVAIPLMDTFNVMGSRMLRRRSPFKADRSHLHHMLSRTSGSPRIALVIMLTLSAVLAVGALAAYSRGVPEPVLFLAALLVFAGYILTQSRVPRFYHALQRRRRQRMALQTALVATTSSDRSRSL